MASFNLWSMELSRKVGTENLDSGDAKVTQIIQLKKKSKRKWIDDTLIR